MKLIQFEDVNHELRPFVPSAVYYDPRNGSQSYGFDALYRAPEGTPNLKTGFKADLIEVLSTDDLQEAYRVDTSEGPVVKRPQEVLEDFLGFVLDNSLRQIEKATASSVKSIGLIIGVPAIEDERRRRNYRDRIKGAVAKALSSLPSRNYPGETRSELLFYEPFAVYKYYREEHAIPSGARGWNVLVVDWGGGTMNLCVIKTTKGGEVEVKGRRASNIPRTIDGIPVGGRILDKSLIDEMFAREDASFRRDVKNCHRDMLDVERAKVNLTNKILAAEEAKPQVRVDVRGKRSYLTGDHLKKAFDKLWSGNIEFKVRKVLQDAGLHAPDLVLLAGGSSRVPFIAQSVKNLFALRDDQILVGENFEQAVACGLAYQASDRLGEGEPAEKLALFIEDDVYLLAAGKVFSVFKKDQAVDEESLTLEKNEKIPLNRPAKRFTAIYTEEVPEDTLEYIRNPTKIRFNLPRASQEVDAHVLANADGYVEAEYRSGGEVIGQHDFYIGVGKLSQWSVDAAIGIDVGTTNTAVGYFVEGKEEAGSPQTSGR